MHDYHIIMIINCHTLYMSRDVFTDSRNEDITAIKDAWKWSNGHPLGLLLGKPFSQRVNTTGGKIAKM